MRLPSSIARFCLVLSAAAFLSSCKKETAEAPLLAITAISPDTGPKTTAVTLTGTGFSSDPAANAVTLNGKPCVVAAASATLLTFAIPAKAGSGPVTVKVNGQAAQSLPFTYILQATVTTLAGSTEGFADGTGTAVQFNFPRGIAAGADGSLYVADIGNNRIRRVTPAGTVTTLAGNTEGFADGTGTAARFDSPSGVAVGADGSLYVADTQNNRIRRVTPAGVVTTLAGSTQGLADGMGTNAWFYFPQGIAVGADGSLYVTDGFNSRIRKITPAGEVTTLAGNGSFGFANGTGTAAAFNFPQGIAVGTDGSLYVTDTENNRIRKVTPAGAVTTLAGSIRGLGGFADGTGTAALFNGPTGIAAGADGSLYVADYYNNRIRKIELK